MVALDLLGDYPERRVFLAGAGGAIGKKLCPLIWGGWHVTGTTRSPAKVAALHALGIDPVIVDVFDAATLRDVVIAARPAIVIHLLTDLPAALDPSKMEEAFVRNSRIREIGTQNLVSAAVAAGAKRIVAQSISFAYAPGPIPYAEDAPLNRNATGSEGATVRGVASLERQILSAPMESVLLRFGKLYGEGTGFENPPSGGPLCVEAAADAVRRALVHGAGIYNIAEDDGTINSQRAKLDLDWRSTFRMQSSKEILRLADTIWRRSMDSSALPDLELKMALERMIDQQRTKQLFDELFDFCWCMTWGGGEEEAALDTLTALERLMSVSSFAACTLMARLFAKASKIKVEYVCDSVIVWILKTKSPELKFQLELQAADSPSEDLKKRYRDWAGTM